MKKSFKKFGVIVLALAMVFALTIPAMAADGDYNANEGTKTSADTTANTIPLVKTVVYFNDESYAVRKPTYTYNYTIAPVTGLSNITVTDASGNKATVNDGDADGVGTSVTIAITSGTVTAKAEGTPESYTGNISVVPNNFPHAGVYRYSITETDADADLAKVGIKGATATNSNIRYLDVYIKNADSGTGLELMGAVIFKTNDSINGDDSDTIPNTTDKTTGFDVFTNPTSDPDYNNDDTVDKYYTYNLTVTKTTTGSMADKTHEFPIEVNLSKAVGLTVDAIVDVSVTNGTISSSGTPTLDADETVTAKLKDGGKLVIKGIPYFPGTTAAYATVNSIKETNDTPDTYTPSATVTDMTDSSLKFSGSAMAPSASETTTGSAAFKADTYSGTIAITNNITDISITGITLRVAPFAAMAGAGVLFLAISKKSKKEEEDA